MRKRLSPQVAHLAAAAHDGFASAAANSSISASVSSTSTLSAPPKFTTEPLPPGLGSIQVTREEILEAYSELKPMDIQEALRYAAEAVRERALPLPPAS